MRVLVLGVSSKIAEETARVLAAKGDELFIVARNKEKLASIAADLTTRGAKRVESACLDLNDIEKHAAIINQAAKALGGLDAALIAHGTLGDQKACESDYAKAEFELLTNMLGPISLLTALANVFEREGRGVIGVITSVAGDRGRQSNYVYGAAKGGLGIFLEGLRNRLAKKGVRVVTIKPGFVDTPMTAGLKKNFLYASPDAVGRRIARALKDGGDVLYVPWFWRYIMLIIKSIPEPIFKKLKL